MGVKTLLQIELERWEKRIAFGWTLKEKIGEWILVFESPDSQVVFSVSLRDPSRYVISPVWPEGEGRIQYQAPGIWTWKIARDRMSGEIAVKLLDWLEKIEPHYLLEIDKRDKGDAIERLKKERINELCEIVGQKRARRHSDWSRPRKRGIDKIEADEQGNISIKTLFLDYGLAMEVVKLIAGESE